jgi:hypothetical protein
MRFGSDRLAKDRLQQGMKRVNAAVISGVWRLTGFTMSNHISLTDQHAVCKIDYMLAG